MLKKLLAVLMISFSILVFSNLARSSVSETTWNIEGTIKVKVSVLGLGSQLEAINFSDEITFHSDGDFEMTDLVGTWQEIRNRFLVNLKPVDVENYFEEFLGKDGLDVTLEITKLSLTGTTQKNGTINGKITLNMNFHLNCIQLDGKLAVIATFKGTVTAGDGVSSDEGNASTLRLESLKGVVQEKLREAIEAAGASVP